MAGDGLKPGVDCAKVVPLPGCTDNKPETLGEGDKATCRVLQVCNPDAKVPITEDCFTASTVPPPVEEVVPVVTPVVVVPPVVVAPPAETVVVPPAETTPAETTPAEAVPESDEEVAMHA